MTPPTPIFDEEDDEMSKWTDEVYERYEKRIADQRHRDRIIAAQKPLPDPERREPLPGQAELPLSPGEFTLTGELKPKRRKR